MFVTGLLHFGQVTTTFGLSFSSMPFVPFRQDALECQALGLGSLPRRGRSGLASEGLRAMEFLGLEPATLPLLGLAI